METAIPKWFHYLESQGISQFWLSSLEASTVCDFSSRCPRVGLFLDFLENEKDGQPSVQWCVDVGVFQCELGQPAHMAKEMSKE